MRFTFQLVDFAWNLELQQFPYLCSCFIYFFYHRAWLIKFVGLHTHTHSEGAQRYGYGHTDSKSMWFPLKTLSMSFLWCGKLNCIFPSLRRAHRFATFPPQLGIIDNTEVANGWMTLTLIYDWALGVSEIIFANSFMVTHNSM